MSRERADDQAYLLNSRGTERFSTPHFSPRPRDPVAPVIRRELKRRNFIAWLAVGIACGLLFGLGFLFAYVRWWPHG